MAVFTLSSAVYRTKVHGCWLGKTVGGTLGQPHEGKAGPLELTFYDPVPDGAIANDDLDLQLVWLARLRQVGPGITERDLGEAWRECVTFPWDEYGVCKANLFEGLQPPISGQHNNWFTDSMGAPIRSEIWACLAPGCPDLAATLAYQDGCVDHGGEGLFGEIFFAALESAAFVLSDPDELLDLALGFIPADSRTARAVEVCRSSHAAGDDWLACREAILQAAGHANFTDAPQNIAFTVLGWLYGEDPGDAMCKAVNCGQDTDCTGATLGAILGIIGGPECFDKRWTEPVGNEVKVSYGVVNCEVPATLDQLTDWTIEAAEKMLQHHESPVRIGQQEKLSGLTAADLGDQGRVKARLAELDWKLSRSREDLQLISDLGGAPTFAPGETVTVGLTARGAVPDDAYLALSCPEGWWLRPGASHREPGLLRRSFTLGAPALGELSCAQHLQAALVGDERVLIDDSVTLLRKHGWRVTGPIALVGSLLGVLDARAPEDGWRPLYTDGHELVLDHGLSYDRFYFVQTVLHNPHRRPGRIVAASPELQVVHLVQEEIIRKTEPTRFVPAPHRSGPGTVFEADELPRVMPLSITIVARAGRPALLHLYLTETADPANIIRCCPLVGVVATCE